MRTRGTSTVFLAVIPFILNSRSKHEVWCYTIVISMYIFMYLSAAWCHTVFRKVKDVESIQKLLGNVNKELKFPVNNYPSNYNISSLLSRGDVEYPNTTGYPLRWFHQPWLEARTKACHWSALPKVEDRRCTFRLPNHLSHQPQEGVFWLGR